ncbi:glycoside hydrolase family 140 protein [Echinicola marina]|nr:glycoside hydrolase family 140 protein [Echinicola marina]
MINRFMKTLFFTFSALLLSLCSLAQSNLTVSDNGRFLVYQDGTPFFYLGDTAWELFHRLNRGEAYLYLKDRAGKGFTVIQAVVLAEHNGLEEPNAYGELPLTDNDPAKPNEAYFKHVDFVIEKAAELNLHIALLPTWGDKVFKNKWGVGPEIFNPENAYKYGRFIGNRYKHNRNIIWVIGGDRNPREDSDDVEIWRAMARGIVETVGGNDKALMTFHPQTASSTWFHEDEWLDFNMLQTSHCADTKVWEKISHDYNLKPVKPTMDGEPMYEEIPVCFDLEKNGYSDPNDVRRKAYLSLFAGAHGHTYGCNNVWQMYAPERKRHISATRPWYESLDLPGASSMTFVRKLMESRPMLDRIPDPSMIVSSSDHYRERVMATRGNDYAFIYSSSGHPFEVVMGRISGKRVKASWYNPRTGETTIAGVYKNKGVRKFTPPSQGNEHDWVLIMDDVKRAY